MIIESIELSNFRNYENLQIHLDEGTNILYGDNAQGKTNIRSCVYEWYNKIPQRKPGQGNDSVWRKRIPYSYRCQKE